MLRSLLAGLIDRPDLRSELSQRARARALELSPTRMADAYERTYQEAMTRGRQPEAQCAR